MLAAERLVDWGPLPASVTQAFEVALEALERDLGLSVERIGPGDIFTVGNIDDDWFVMATVEQAYELGRETIARETRRFTDVFAYCMQQGLAYTAEEYATLRRRRFAYVKELDELLAADVVLATPTLCVEEQSAEGRVPGHDGIGTPAWVYNTQAQNVTGHPAITLPAGILPSGLPFGLELTGPRFRDDLLLACGRAWEEARPWPRVASGYEEFWTVQT